jgi:hypothetical protein
MRLVVGISIDPSRRRPAELRVIQRGSAIRNWGLGRLPDVQRHVVSIARLDKARHLRFGVRESVSVDADFIQECGKARRIAVDPDSRVAHVRHRHELPASTRRLPRRSRHHKDPGLWLDNRQRQVLKPVLRIRDAAQAQERHSSINLGNHMPLQFRAEAKPMDDLVDNLGSALICDQRPNQGDECLIRKRVEWLACIRPVHVGHSLTVSLDAGRIHIAVALGTCSEL